MLLYEKEKGKLNKQNTILSRNNNQITELQNLNSSLNTDILNLNNKINKYNEAKIRLNNLKQEINNILSNITLQETYNTHSYSNHRNKTVNYEKTRKHRKAKTKDSRKIK
ncbi:hypothetical protein NWQ34_05710 [Mycoplasmopsis felis]|uniref:hypothetical protein n=1 Tax=Mycoplasmopsis felis TaxID=33923 RepID=UPI0021E03083|nr:hypothetical protein [Mycoplasmopsis felis]MCU9939050.1 hypothetical protein [Mycoplasmopsis felis]